MVKKGRARKRGKKERVKNRKERERERDNLQNVHSPFKQQIFREKAEQSNLKEAFFTISFLGFFWWHLVVFY